MVIKMIYKFKKRAILFSLISILFAVLFITLYSQNFSTIYEDRLPGSNIRIKVIDTYTRNFEKYVENSIKVSSYNSLEAITKYRYTHGKFFNDFKEFNYTFYNCMMCGYTNCSNRNSTYNCSISDHSLIDRLNNITNLSKDELNIKTEYVVNSIRIEEQHDFEVQVTVNISYNITDDSAGQNYAKWRKEKIIVQQISIVGLIDPKGYLNDSTNSYTRAIKKYRGNCTTDPLCWSSATVEQFYNENSFRFSKRGASFLNRYWNNMTPSECCGIETILHPSELSPLDENNSYIDTYYWDGTRTCENNTILTIDFGIDEVHLDSASASAYNINNSAIYCIPSP
ncbi:MAG: hypothetical protein ACP5N1_00740 [Candidatus Woesearchaeota archaeon]